MTAWPPLAVGLVLAGGMALASGTASAGGPAMAGPGARARQAPSPAARPSGAELTLRFRLIDNPAAGSPGFRAHFELGNRGAVALPGVGWELYFNFGRPVDVTAGGAVVSHVNGDLRRLGPGDGFAPLGPGEVRRIELAGRGSVTRRSDAPAGPYVVFADGRAEPIGDYEVAPFTDLSALDRMPGDRLPVATAGVLFERQRGLTRLPPERVGRVVPTPLRVELEAAELTLDSSWRIHHESGLERQAELLAEALEPHLGARPAIVRGAPQTAEAVYLTTQTAEAVYLTTQTAETGYPTAPTAEAAPLGAATAGVAVPAGERDSSGEAYRLVVGKAGVVRISGDGPAGVLYGIQTLRALLRPAPGGGSARLPIARVADAPRFPYRGLHLDVARNFHSRATVERLLDLAALYKLNRFHFHLTDDEGWRLPVAALPELTEVGGRRGHTGDESDRLPPSFGSGPEPDVAPGSGHYSRADMIAILRYARDRHIAVVPEIDVPGHARAAIVSMAARQARLLAAGRAGEAAAYLLRHPEDRSEYRSVQGWDDNVVDVCMPSTYRFLATVFDEIVELWAEAEAPLDAIHVGGDEVPAGVWRGSPACAELLRADPELDGVDDLPAYFLRRVGALLAERGLATAGWEEIALEPAAAGGHAKRPNRAFLGRDFRPYVWNNVWGWGGEDLGYRLANEGYPVVLANATNLYFDLAYDKHPEEPGYAWAGFVDTRKAWEFVPLDLYRSARTDLMGRPLDPAGFAGRARLTAEGRRRVRGIQGQLWAENSKSPALLDYQAFPKLLGLAERAWAAQPAWARVEETGERRRLEELAWNEFANRLGQRELPRLDRLGGGVGYRLPPPGAIVCDGRLHANAAFPGLTIRYATEGKKPTAASPLYDGPVPVDGAVVLRSFDTRGRGSRAVTAEIVGDRPCPAPRAQTGSGAGPSRRSSSSRFIVSQVASSSG